MGIIAWIFIGLIAGWLATQILDGSGGLLRNLAVGLVGAIVAASCSRSCGSRSCRISGAI